MPDSAIETTEINTFEEYTLYSLEQSVPALLNMMERGKQIAVMWPDHMAWTAGAALCQEVAALASYQSSVAETLGLIDDPCGEKWKQARTEIKGVMQSFETALDFTDPELAKKLFGVELPNALNHFVEIIPEMTAYIRTTYLTSDGDGREESM